MTSNIGSHHIQEYLSEKQDFKYSDSKVSETLKERVMNELKTFFRPEFLNRVDEIIVFNPLSDDLLKDIVKIQIMRLKKYLDSKKISLSLTDRALQYIAKSGYDPVFGARPLKRAIQREILNKLATKLLEGEIKEGDNIEADLINDCIIFEKVAQGEI
ncbi:MAG: AAA family ATPase [Thermodesulfovibrionales bacterium]|nr:AAA family ATPase [Thermodesulfovibrionales bacterium]